MERAALTTARWHGALARALPILALAACARAPSPPAPAPPPSSAPPALTASATSSAPVPPVAPPSPLSLFAEGWEVTVADTHGPVVVHDSLLSTMFTVEGERVSRVEAPFQRLPTGPEVLGTITGAWPKGALLTLRTGEDLIQFFGWAEDAWEVQHITRAYGHGYFREAYIRDLGGVTYHVAGPDHPTLAVIDAAGPDGRAMALMFPTDPGRPVLSLGGNSEPRLLGLVTMDAKRTRVTQATALPSGEIALLAEYSRDKPDDNGWVIERWRAGQAAHTLTEVEGTRSDNFAVSTCLSPEGTLHVVRHDKASGASAVLSSRGSGWSVTEVPGARRKGPPSRCAVARDGSVWFLLDDGEELYRLTPERTVERIPYPALPPPVRRLRIAGDHAAVELVPAAQQAPGTFSGTRIHVADDGSIWVSGVRREAGKVVDTGHPARLSFNRGAVLRLGPALPGSPIEWDDLQLGAVAEQLATFAVAGTGSPDLDFSTGPVKPDCQRVFVRLLTLPKKPPPHEDFPAVRDVVRGRADLASVHFVEGRIENEPVLGALAPDLDTGRRVLSVLKGHLPGAGARLYCGRPNIVRVIPMGITGGQ